MTEEKEEDSRASREFTNRATTLYGAYRQAGWALSSTTIGFATVLLAWGLPPAAESAEATRPWFIQAALALLTIAFSFAQQFFYYQGSMKLARSLFGQSTQQESNRQFSWADRFAGLSCALLALALVASIGLWVSRHKDRAVELVGRFQVPASGDSSMLVDTTSGRTWVKCTTPAGQGFAAGQEGWCVLYYEGHAPRLDEKLFGLSYPEAPVKRDHLR